jgi:RNA polymerase sigma-70 factor (ECF subfamily)
MNEDSDGVLVRRCCGGDRRAFETLVTRYEKPVYNAALRMLHDREEARDVAQTVFLKAYEHLADYDPSHRFYSWIYRIALNESINSLHRRRPHAALDLEAPDGEPGPDDMLGQRQLGAGLAAAIMGLSAEYRAVIVLRHFLDCSYEDIATILELPEKTVKSRLFSARQSLRTAMQSRGWTRE